MIDNIEITSVSYKDSFNDTENILFKFSDKSEVEFFDMPKHRPEMMEFMYEAYWPAESDDDEDDVQSGYIFTKEDDVIDYDGGYDLPINVVKALHELKFNFKNEVKPLKFI